MSRVRIGTMAILAAGAMLAAGCGDKESTGGKKEGRKLFKDKCGVCHSLKDAGSTGTTGPDLDLVKPDADRVSTAIKNGNAVMPKNLFKGEKRDTVAEYVASVAGKTEAAE